SIAPKSATLTILSCAWAICPIDTNKAMNTGIFLNFIYFSLLFIISLFSNDQYRSTVFFYVYCEFTVQYLYVFCYKGDNHLTIMFILGIDFPTNRIGYTIRGIPIQ